MLKCEVMKCLLRHKVTIFNEGHSMMNLLNIYKKVNKKF